MHFEVQLTDDAVSDLSDMYRYITMNDGDVAAKRMLDKFEVCFLSLAEFPERGVYPAELLALGMQEYRELFVHTYRIIYRVINQSVYVLLIADGRRDMQQLLERRLLGG